MTHEITGHDEKNFGENKPSEDGSLTPLCLMHYFGGSASDPPGDKQIGRIAERRGNLLILEFAPPPEKAREKARAKRPGSKSLSARIGDWLMPLLFLACLLGCLAAFRF